MSLNEKHVNMDIEQSTNPRSALDPHADSAAKFLNEVQEYPPLTPEQEKKLIRKVDWIMIPILFITATLGAVDKVALGTAAINGLRTDTNLVGQ
ncbi:hypothetical protein DM02DRAFT_662053 [Periconia macrospinosa]|uniref:MFS general substrate transporter n=1 Tax=Periconia macrospinosa TaxID=97972 RepID=A0A2V1D7W5_9PLEO|nr:hypothetical protein DM02DRAFT_662053 [Periconia macrospinosa]